MRGYLKIPFQASESLSIPYAIRLRQCLVQYNSPSNDSRSPLFNALKYASSFPVIFLSAAQRIVASDVAAMISKNAAELPWHSEHQHFRLLSVTIQPSFEMLASDTIHQTLSGGCKFLVLLLVGCIQRLGSRSASTETC